MSLRNYTLLLRLAFPIILANSAVPILGLVDTAVIGQTGDASDLGAIALAALVFSFVYWGFGFLRMGTTGFMAQAYGANDQDEMHALVFRTVLIGLLIGISLIILQKPIELIATHFLNASPAVNAGVRDYFYIRIWGAPATLITFSLLGTFIGMGWTAHLLWVQLLLNGLNMGLNILLVMGLGMGVKGIALGTVLAEWIALAFALFLLFPKMGIHQPWQRAQALQQRIFDKVRMLALFQVNRDIMIRTLVLITGFAWFAKQGANFGDETLAANHILLQFVSLSAFFLDGYANVAEMRVGHAYGAKDKIRFKREVTDTTVLAAVTALLLALLVFFYANTFITGLTQDLDVQATASQYKNLAAIYIFVSFAAFQLDGIFIGVTHTKAMRNSALIALGVLVGLGSWWASQYQNTGLWWALIMYVIARAVVLGWYYPTIMKKI